MPSDEYKGVWAYIEHENGEISRPTLEILAAGRKVAERLGEELVGIVLGYHVDETVTKALEYGADRVIYSDDSRLREYLCLPYTSVITQMVQAERPYALLFLANEIGKDLAPRVAYRLKTGLATDNIELEIEDYYHVPTKSTHRNLLIQIRPDFATRIAKIYTPWHRPQIATVRPGNFSPATRKVDKRGRVTKFEPQFSQWDFSVILEHVREIQRTSVDLEGALVVISVGLGILRDAKGNPKDPSEGYQLAKQLAETIRDKFGLKTEIGASRALIYAELRELDGLITNDHQVGQTGKTVSPEIYFALGISGSVQHRVGMLRSKRIVAVNTDPNAPIFQIAHYPIIGDLYDEVPRLIENIRAL